MSLHYASYMGRSFGNSSTPVEGGVIGKSRNTNPFHVLQTRKQSLVMYYPIFAFFWVMNCTDIIVTIPLKQCFTLTITYQL
jgi:hypothetical protein